MKTLVDVKKERQGLLGEMREILDKVQREERELTDDERILYDNLEDKVRSLNLEIEANTHDGVHEVKPGDNTKLTLADRFPHLNMDSLPKGEIRFLQPSEKLSTYTRGDRKYERLNLGKLCLLGAGESVPDADLERRALSTASDLAGGFLVPDEISRQIWDMSRAKAVVMKGGAVTVEMPGQNFRIPKLVKDPEGTWKAELAEAPDTGAEFAAVEMRARTLMFWIEISRELTEDAVGLDAAIRNAMAQSAALEIDRAAIFGIGAGEQPMGLYVDADVTKLAVTPGAYWDDVSLSMKAIENANLTPSAVLMSPQTHHILRVLRDGEGRFQPAPAWCPQILVSKQITDTLGAGSNESIVITGDFSNLIIGIRSGYHLEVLKEAKAQKYAIVLLAAVRLDTAIVRGEGFHILTGLTTSWG